MKTRIIKPNTKRKVEGFELGGIFLDESKPQHTPTLKLILKQDHDHAFGRDYWTVNLDDGTGLGAQLMKTFDQSIADGIVRAVNSHDELVTMLKRVTSQYEAFCTQN